LDVHGMRSIARSMFLEQAFPDVDHVIGFHGIGQACLDRLK
jgi:hypothetical protein